MQQSNCCTNNLFRDVSLIWLSMLKPHSQIEMEQHWTVVVLANFNKLENLTWYVTFGPISFQQFTIFLRNQMLEVNDWKFDHSTFNVALPIKLKDYVQHFAHIWMSHKMRTNVQFQANHNLSTNHVNVLSQCKLRCFIMGVEMVVLVIWM